MSVSSLSSYASLSSLWGNNVSELYAKSASDPDSRRQKTDSSIIASSGSSAYGTTTGNLSNLGTALSAAMDSLGLSSEDRVTFQTLMEYRDKLEDQFTAQVKNDLRKLGVDEEIEFRLSSGSDGTGLAVITDHQDKAVVEQYFADNPSMVRQFEQLQSLNKMEETRRSQGIDLKAIRTRLQMESMSAWFSGNAGFMAYAAGSGSWYNGLSTVV